MIYLSKITKGLLCLVAALLLAGLLIYAKAISSAVATGISICLEILIPSLYIFLIFSQLVVKTGWLNPLFKPFGFLLGKLFHIDTHLGTVLFMSLCCGYPVGGKLLSQMVMEGKLSISTANRMLAYCVNAGPAFLIGSVAVPLFGDLRFGLILFLSQICGFLFVGMVSGIGKKPEPYGKRTEKVPFSCALVESVSSASRSMLIICSFVILFSGIIGLIRLSGFPETIAAFFYPPLPQAHIEGMLYGFLEISNGIIYLKQQSAFYIAVLLSAFGGLCVHMQIHAMIKPAGLSLKTFYMFRPLYILISLLSAKGLLSLFPIDLPTSLGETPLHAEYFSTLPLCSFFLLLLSIFLLLCDKKSAIIKKDHKMRKEKRWQFFLEKT